VPWLSLSRNPNPYPQLLANDHVTHLHSRYMKISSAFTKSAFSIALALLFTLVLNSLARQITPPPQFSTEPYPDISTEETCTLSGGRWIVGSEPDLTREKIGPNAPTLASYCQGPLAFERQRELQAAASEQTAMFVFAIGGALAIAAGLTAKQLKPIAPGLLLAGVFSFLVTGFHVWRLAPGFGRLATIIAIFLIMAILGLRVFTSNAKET
jgi:uncharacterized membrane protein